MKILVVVATAFLVAGCTSNYQTLANDRGQRVFCKSEGYGVAGTIFAETKFSDCVKRYEARGFIKND